MTIRQQGGVFGRNPVFENVDATNLTFAYKYSVVNAASNHRVNVRVG